MRPDWDEYFLDIAKSVASRSSCIRNKVGAVIVRNKAIISTGYNGSPQYQRNCIEIGFCYRNKNNIKSGTQLECCRAVGSHAESNAISLAARNGNAIEDSTIYIVGHNFVCIQCRALIANTNIKRVVLLTTDNEKLVFSPSEEWKIHPIDENE
jgi:dCMP deaminase